MSRRYVSSKVGGGGELKSEREERRELRERDQSVIASLYMRGKANYEIAETLTRVYYPDGSGKWNSAKVGREISKLKAIWVKTALLNFNSAKAAILLKLDELERACWEGWDNSLREQEERLHEEERISEPLGDLPGEFAALEPARANETARIKTRRKSSSRDGDPRWLTELRNITDMRCKIYGLYSPEKFQLDWRTEAVQAGMTDSSAVQEFQDLLVEKAAGYIVANNRGKDEFLWGDDTDD